MPEMKQHQTLPSWADESHEDAIAIAYLGGELKVANWQAWESRQIQKDDVPELPTGYEANARELLAGAWPWPVIAWRRFWIKR